MSGEGKWFDEPLERVLTRLSLAGAAEVAWPERDHTGSDRIRPNDRVVLVAHAGSGPVLVGRGLAVSRWWDCVSEASCGDEDVEWFLSLRCDALCPPERGRPLDALPQRSVSDVVQLDGHVADRLFETADLLASPDEQPDPPSAAARQTRALFEERVSRYRSEQAEEGAEEWRPPRHAVQPEERLMHLLAAEGAPVALALAETFRAEFPLPDRTWSISCLPSTGATAYRRRAFTLNLSGLELLWVYLDVPSGCAQGWGSLVADEEIEAAKGLGLAAWPVTSPHGSFVQSLDPYALVAYLAEPNLNAALHDVIDRRLEKNPKRREAWHSAPLAALCDPER